MSYLEEKTYKNLLGTLNEPGKVWAECVFADPIADVAILSMPDDQALSEQSDAYEQLSDAVNPLRLREAIEGETVWVLDLDGQFRSGIVKEVNDTFVQVLGCVMKPGMSGSPLLGNDGAAISVCVLGFENKMGAHEMTAQRNLPEALPRWFPIEDDNG